MVVLYIYPLGVGLIRFASLSSPASNLCLQPSSPPEEVVVDIELRAMVLLISYLLSAFACTALYPTIGTVSARKPDRMHIEALRRKAADRVNKNRLTVAVDSDSVRSSSGVKNFTFSNPAASGQLSLARKMTGGLCLPRNVAFYVDGTTIPDVDWDVGPSWAGLLPISGDENETRKVSYPFACFDLTVCMDAESSLCSCSFGSSRPGRRGETIR